MKTRMASIIMKWSTAMILASSTVMIFLPYRSGIDLVTMFDSIIKLNDMGTLVVEGIIRFVMPIVLNLTAAVIIATMYRMSKCIVASGLNLLASLLYLSFYFEFSKDFYGAGIGLTLNFIISVLGVVLPLAIIALITYGKKIDGFTDRNHRDYTSATSLRTQNLNALQTKVPQRTSVHCKSKQCCGRWRVCSKAQQVK
ncbi:MAG: hypothetical protein LBD16_00740 [Oscillospiraceae bacterium]|jgi:hypothetical protein|nr:hypothetical protein [Oscillospiraceae bacterium]